MRTYTCRKVCYSKAAITARNLSNTGKKRFMSNQFMKVFIYKGALNTHTHSPTLVSKMQNARSVGKKFSIKNYLKKHILSHIGLKNYECQEHGRRFSHKSSPNAHTLTHTGVRNFKCQECGKMHTPLLTLV